MRQASYITIFLAIGLGMNAAANPTGMTVASGSASAQADGSQLTITTGNRTVLNWQTFNIAEGETTIFNQPSISSIVINNIHDANASQIYGTLQANGLVVLMNQNGFYFGPNSFVKTGGLIVSTANCVPPQNSGGSWEFNGPPPLASIINYGKINVGQNGSAFLIADHIENHGDIEAPGGAIGLADGQTVLLSERPDGRGLSMQVTLPSGSVDNSGKLVADAGTIAMQAKVVNQNGFIQANSVRDQNGVIELVADDSLNLGANSQIVAQGDDSSPNSDGGTVTLQSGNIFSDSVGSQISVRGGAQGGDGGSVEVSAPNILSLNSQMDASAQEGFSAGNLFLDPNNINLNTTGTDSAGGGTVLAGGTGTLNLNVNTAFAGFSQIILQANNTITLADGTAWNLSASTHNNSGQLILEAGQNIVFGNNASLFDANNWSVSLYAGVSTFSTSMPTVKSGVGSINLNLFSSSTPNQQNSFIQMASGSVNLVAGLNVTVGVGYVNTTGGGDIYVHALAGNIDTGNFAQGYHFNANAGSLASAYTLQNGLGGISTAAGGDVTLIAGGNITSVLPVKGAYLYDGNSKKPNNGNDYVTAGAGAYGRQANGNVTVVAGGNVVGNYVVADGTGKIFAGVKMDANGNPLQDISGNYILGTTGSAGTSSLSPNFALTLINGGWNVSAAQNILLQEVRNPNGVFDISGGSAFNHLFDYGPDDYVNLSAGNMVQLGTSSSLLPLPRLSGITVPIIFPSILDISAGAGGVTLTGDSTFNQLILFPSPEGSLVINTTGGGSLISRLPSIQGAPQLFNLIVSGSGRSQFTTSSSFGLNDFATIPIHLNNSTPIELNISGNMNLVELAVPEAAQINVVGNMNNCRFQGMNLSADDITSINVGQTAKQAMENNGLLNPATDGNIAVGGDIINRSLFTSIDLSQVSGSEQPDLSVLAHAYNNFINGSPVSATTLASSFFYSGTTLTYENIDGVSLPNILQLLQNLTVQVYKNGVPQWQDVFHTIPVTTTLSVLDPATAAALLAQYNSLGPIPNGATSGGFFIGGGGQFNISARNIDLGTSAGIQSLGVSYGRTGSIYPLANLFGDGGVFQHGTDISIDASGDLNMYSSSIASLNGGDISITAGGVVNAGSSVFTVNASSIRGIYTTSGGNISLTAGGDVNVNGSRIITYDGGDISVVSLNGNVNAGRGATTPVSVTAYYEDPVSHIVYSTSPLIPFSGIAALTFPRRDAFYPAPAAVLGNIFIEAPNGNVSATGAGILQIPLNRLKYPDATLTILAGYQENGGSPEYALDNGNIITFGPTTQLFQSPGVPFLDQGQPVFVTQLLDANGQPVFDSTGHPFYVENLYQNLQKNVKDSPIITYSIAGGKLTINPYLDPAEDPIDAVMLSNPEGPGSDAVFVYGRNINAKGSGIIASNARLLATGNLIGLIFARNNLDLAAQNADVTALAQGNINASVQDSLQGSLTGVGGVSVSGSDIQAALISDSVSGATSGQSGLGQGTAANATSQAAATEDASQTAVSSDQSNEDDSKKKDKSIALAQKTGRVTVVLPAKNQNKT